ncbi:MAG: NTP transferase domain-containing protein [Coriobacteriales bacterium]|jgi:UTP--glucose-1-phosphate uridylyltransferase|nr:NTP transferase domain-containing protein [Coriobacteriales bacterium]
MKAIIPAAGLGTRFLPATKATPKEMLPVLNKPAIQYVVEEALTAADEVLIITNSDKPSIAAHFSPARELAEFLVKKEKPSLAAAVVAAGSLPVSFVEQTEPRGLGHAVLCAAEAVATGMGAGGSADVAPDPFFVLLGDVLVPGNDVLVRMAEVSKAHDGASVIAVFRVPHEQVSRFGVIDGTPAEGGVVLAGAPGTEVSVPAVWKINALVEKPSVDEAPSNLAIFGRYLLSPAVMEILAHTEPGAGGEIQLTDALSELLQSEEIFAIEVDADAGFDTGTIASWLETNIRLALSDPELAAVVRKSVGQGGAD